MSDIAAENACRKGISDILAAFVDGLEERARHSGALSVEDIAEIHDRFAQNGILDAAARVIAAGMKDEGDEEKKKDAFGRMIVKPFAHLLDAGFPRKRLRSFFETLRVILGDAALSAAENACAKRAEELIEIKGRKFSWDDIYADSECRSVVDATLAKIAEAFRPNFQKRLDWFAGTLDHDVKTRSTDSMGFMQIENEGHIPHVSKEAAETLLLNLYADTHPDGMQAERRAELEKRAGSEGIFALAAMHFAFETRARRRPQTANR
jgi:hypothetical protein